MDQKELVGIVYADDIKGAVERVMRITEEKDLFYVISRYNWDNGFELPEAVLNNQACSREIALTLFFDAEGASYLEDKTINEDLPMWRSFIIKLYENIVNNVYNIGTIGFSVPLSKVQIYKLKKVLSEKEMVFIQEI